MCEALNAYLLKVGGGETGTGGPLELLAQAACNGSAKTSWVEREYIWGPGDVDECLMQIGRQGEQMFVLNDGNNNVVGLTGPTGAMLEQYTYEPYSALIRAESLATHPVNKLGHQGLFFDHFVASTDGRILVPETTGLYYNRNRHYSPTMGRFLQRDPNDTGQPLSAALMRNGATPAVDAAKADVQGLYGDGMNLYTYVGCNPTNRIDPSGLFMGLLDLSGAMGLATDLDTDTIDSGMTLIDAVGGLVGHYNRPNSLLFELLGSSGADGSAIDSLLSMYDAFQKVRNAKMTAGFIRAGAAFAAQGFGSFLSTGRRVLKDRLRGQVHHAISKAVHDALEQHPLLKGKYKYRDTRFASRAVDTAAHVGLQGWHRDYNSEIANWVRKNRGANESAFEAMLQQVYSRPEMLALFPAGLGPEALFR